MRRLTWALRRRCPNCGIGAVFQSWSKLVERCPSCSHRFERHEGYWLGAIATNTAATILIFMAVFVGMTVLLWPDPPWALISVITVAVNLVFPVAFYPYSKTLWVAIELSLHPVPHPTPPAES